jgi:Luciferase
VSLLQSFIDRLAALPEPVGETPRMTAGNPQEQLEQFPRSWSLVEELHAFAFSLERVIEAPTQIAPPGSRALTLGQDDAGKNRDAFLIGNEFAHIHNPPIGSMHLTLPNPLRELAMAKRWVLPHPLAGKHGLTPDNVFAFAPRDAGEVEVAKVLLSASHAHALGRL